MSLLLPGYIDYLRQQLDDEGADIPAEEMTDDVRAFFDRMFDEALESEEEPETPEPTDVPPGPLKVAVMRGRYERGEMIFHPTSDFRWEHVKAEIGRAVTLRATDNDRPLEDALLAERAVQDDIRAAEAVRKARRNGDILPFAPREEVRR